MSKFHTEQLTCPRCHYDSPIEIWDSINVDLNPEMKDPLLDGRLYHWTCEVCGLEIDVPFVTMYHDMQHRFILFFSPWDDETHHYAEIPIIDKAGFEGYIFRSVYGINQLREKIAILESGLDDVAVERMKFFLYLDPMSELRCDDKVYFIGINMNSETAQVARMKRGAIQFARIRQGVKPNIMTYPMELYYDYLLAVQKDPRMTIATCACIDNGWIRYKLQQMS